MTRLRDCPPSALPTMRPVRILAAVFALGLLPAGRGLCQECAERCEAKLVRITAGAFLKVETYNNDGKLVDAKPLGGAPDSEGIQGALKKEIERLQTTAPLKDKGCEKGCRCLVDRNDPSLKWIENPGNFTVTVTFRHLAGRDVYIWKAKREVAIGSGICDIEPPQ